MCHFCEAAQELNKSLSERNHNLCRRTPMETKGLLIRLEEKPGRVAEALMSQASEFFATAPQIEKVDILAVK